ncbi:hypothetical protein JCM1841_002050 [Sporobolomyces salmonicolor]
MAATPPKAPSRQLIVILVAGMLVTGCSNSLWSKYQDMQCVENCDSPDPTQHRNFEQPVAQTMCMFAGETICLLAFNMINSRFNPFRIAKRRRADAAAREAALVSNSARLAAAPLSRPEESAFAFNESAISLQGQDREEAGMAYKAKMKAAESDPAKMNWKEALMFWGPAVCDICGTTAMNVGLFFVPVSVYQMLRGALVLWVGVFSVIFLGRKLNRAQWTALAVCMAGVAVVGSSSLIGPKPDAHGPDEAVEEAPSVSPLVGVLLVLLAQIFTATQFVLEERIMEHHAVEPLLAAGYEGVFGLLTTLSGLLVIYRLWGSTPQGQGGYFDVVAMWHQIADYPRVWGSSIIIAISIALFNFCGLAVTRTVSATARSTIDTCRTLGIWVVSLFLGWESFKSLQVLGFALLVYGTFVFNGITSFPHWTGLHSDAELLVPSVVLPPDADLSDASDDDASDDDERTAARATDVDSLGRAATRRSGSGRRGEHSPLLKNARE